MRAITACFMVFLGLGAVTALATTMAGCSDTSDAGSGGASGAGTSAGASSGGASAGAAATCSFSSIACIGCIGNKCEAQFGACNADAVCKAALAELSPCVCNGSDVMACQGTFVTDGDRLALDLTECYTLNDCDQVCE